MSLRALTCILLIFSKNDRSCEYRIRTAILRINEEVWDEKNSLVGYLNAKTYCQIRKQSAMMAESKFICERP